MERKGQDSVIDDEDEAIIAAALSRALETVKPGTANASEYHRLMVGAVEFISSPTYSTP